MSHARPVEVKVDDGPAPSELLWRKHLALLVLSPPLPTPHQDSRPPHRHPMGRSHRSRRATFVSEALRVIRRHAGPESIELTVDRFGSSGPSVGLDVDRLKSWPKRKTGTARPSASRASSSRVLRCLTRPDSRTGSPPSGRTGDGARSKSLYAPAEISHAWGECQAGGLAGRALSIEPTSEPAVRSALRCMALTGDRTGALEPSSVCAPGPGDRYRARRGDARAGRSGAPGRRWPAGRRAGKRRTTHRRPAPAGGPGGGAVSTAGGRSTIGAARRSALLRSRANRAWARRACSRRCYLACGWTEFRSPRPGRSRPIVWSRGAVSWPSPAAACSTRPGTGAAPCRGARRLCRAPAGMGRSLSRSRHAGGHRRSARAQ